MRNITLLMIFAISALAIVAIADVPEEIVIDACGEEKAPVAFPHKAHFEFAACVDCHHTSEGLTAETVADMTVETCFSCHAEPEDAETPKCSEKSTKKNPYHIRCVGCHKEYKKEHADTTAPTKCNACHPKEG
jgi:hypothetical protein